MMADRDPQELADQLEREADALERHSSQLAEETKRVRQDWERKRSDAGVPGAQPPETGGDEPEAEFPAKAQSKQDED